MEEEELIGEEEFEEEPVDEETLFIQREIAECFAVFDPKNKGYMPTMFLDKALRSIGIGLTPFELEEVVEKYDNNGSIELPDFQALAIERIREIEPDRILRDAFEALDLDKERVIPSERFKRWMTTLGDPLTESEAKELYRMGDPANKGVFAYDDVINALIF